MNSFEILILRIIRMLRLVRIWELVKFLEDQAEKSDLKQAAKDVERFLFYPEQAQWILKLPEYLKGFEK